MSGNVTFASLSAELRRNILLEALIANHLERVYANPLERTPRTTKKLGWVADLRLVCRLFWTDVEEVLHSYGLFIVQTCYVIYSESQLMEAQPFSTPRFFGGTGEMGIEKMRERAEQQHYIVEQQRYNLAVKWAVGLLLSQEKQPLHMRSWPARSDKRDFLDMILLNDRQMLDPEPSTIMQISSLILNMTPGIDPRVATSGSMEKRHKEKHSSGGAPNDPLYTQFDRLSRFEELNEFLDPVYPAKRRRPSWTIPDNQTAEQRMEHNAHRALKIKDAKLRNDFLEILNETQLTRMKPSDQEQILKNKTPYDADASIKIVKHLSLAAPDVSKAPNRDDAALNEAANHSKISQPREHEGAS